MLGEIQEFAPGLSIIIILAVSAWAVVWPVRWFLGRR